MCKLLIQKMKLFIKFITHDLTKPPCDVVFCSLIRWYGEEFFRIIVLYDFSKRKNAVLSDTRTACCILCVTHNDSIVLFQFHRKVFDLDVEIGSSAEVGSSMRRTSGSTASALAIQSLCCCPPDMPSALVLRRSLHSSQIAAFLSDLFYNIIQL